MTVLSDFRMLKLLLLFCPTIFHISFVCLVHGGVPVLNFWSYQLMHAQRRAASKQQEAERYMPQVCITVELTGQINLQAAYPCHIESGSI